MAELTVISLGWGVQSWTLAAMSVLGELPAVDMIIHADTTWEAQRTYEFATQWGPWLIDHGANLFTVGDPGQAAAVTTHKTDIPAFTIGPPSEVPIFEMVPNVNGQQILLHEYLDEDEIGDDDDPNEMITPEMLRVYKPGQINGQLRRQCTNRWKIVPIRRVIAEELKRRGLRKSPGVVEQWLGITTDEWTRAKDSDVKYTTHRYPLLEKDMSRNDCLQWLKGHDLPTPGKSACTFCPYHSKKTWEAMKREDGADWKQAIEIDLKIRNTRPPYPLFVHPARKPLDEAVMISEDFGIEQPALSDDTECDSGYCFL